MKLEIIHSEAIDFRADAFNHLQTGFCGGHGSGFVVGDPGTGNPDHFRDRFQLQCGKTDIDVSLVWRVKDSPQKGDSRSGVIIWRKVAQLWSLSRHRPCMPSSLSASAF